MSERKSSVPAPRPSRPATARNDGSIRSRIAARAPSAAQRAAATTIALRDEDATSVAAIIAKLPDPASLAPGALVVLPGEIASAGRSLARSVLAVFGRAKTVTRARRCSALVARGYVDVGAAEDDGTRADLAWGYAPTPSAPEAPRPSAPEGT